jgi:hypothetical protein
VQIAPFIAPRVLGSGLALAAALALCACGGSERPPAPLGLSSAASAAVIGAPHLRAALSAELERLFGPPSAPRFAPLTGRPDFDPNQAGGGALTPALKEALAADNRRRWAELFAALETAPFERLDWPAEAPELDAETIGRARAGAAGWRAEVAAWLEQAQPALIASARSYQRDCSTCHGREGGGDGPSAHFQDPRPRDFRSQEFKHFVPGHRTRPDQEALIGVLFNGVSGTGMPSWRSRPAAVLSGLSDYVRFLAIRGEVELGLARAIAAEGKLPAGLADQLYAAAWSAWGPPGSPPSSGAEAARENP